MWISHPHQNLHSCVSHPVDWSPHLLWQSPSLISVLIFIFDFFCIFCCGKTTEKFRIGTPSRGSAVWVCKLIPCVLASGLRFCDKSQRNEQLLEICLCCASLFCRAPAWLDNIASWLQWNLSLLCKPVLQRTCLTRWHCVLVAMDFPCQTKFWKSRNRGKIGTATCSHQDFSKREHQACEFLYEFISAPAGNLLRWLSSRPVQERKMQYDTFWMYAKMFAYAERKLSDHVHQQVS